MRIIAALLFMVVFYFGWSLFGLSEWSFVSYPDGPKARDVCVKPDGSVSPGSRESCSESFCGDYYTMQLSTEFGIRSPVGVCRNQVSTEMGNPGHAIQKEGDFDEANTFARSHTYVSFWFSSEKGNATVVTTYSDLSQQLASHLNEGSIPEYLARFHRYLIHRTRTTVTKQGDGKYLVKDLFQGSEACGYSSLQVMVSSDGSVIELPNTRKDEQEAQVSDC